MRFLSLLFVAFALVFPHGSLGAPPCSTSIDSSGGDHCASKCKHKHKWGWSHHKGSHTDTGHHTDPGNHPGGGVVATTTTTSTSTTTTPSSTPTPPANNPVLLSQDADQMLSLHNKFRADRGVSGLTWSNELATAAETWADKCKFGHSDGSLGNFGENIAAGTGDFTFEGAFNMWVAEEPDYQPNNPQASHYTQEVWRGTTEVGCACDSKCPGIFSSGIANYCVCEYSPAGNVIGNFAQNVPS